jgi:polyketide biosynthesis enoyl-CoA hydratase PksH
LLFGLFPACVLPFLIRKIGYQKAHYMALLTKPIMADQALNWGLVDVIEDNTSSAVRKHLLRLKRIPKNGIVKYKQYINKLNSSVLDFRILATSSNEEAFSDPQNLERIFQFMEMGNLS